MTSVTSGRMVGVMEPRIDRGEIVEPVIPTPDRTGGFTAGESGRGNRFADAAAAIHLLSIKPTNDPSF